MPSPVTIATVNNTPAGSGNGSQTHIIYAANGALWWAFWFDTADLAHLFCASSPDFVTWTSRTSLTLGTTAPSDGRNFSVAYDSIASVDVIHIDHTSSGGLRFHVRATMSGSTITWGTDVSQSSGLSLPSGNSCALDSGNVVVVAFVATTTPRVARSSNADLGTSWTTGFGSFVNATTNAGTAGSTAVIPLATSNALYVGDNGSGAGVWNNLKSSLFNGTSWGTSVSIRGVALGTAQDPADWGWAKVSNTDTHVVMRTGSNTFEHFRFNGTSWSAGDTMDSVASRTGGGVTLTTDGTNVWAFCIANAAGNDVQYNLWVPGRGWVGWQALGLASATRTKIGCQQTTQGTAAALYWTEGASSPFTLVGYPFVAATPPTQPTALDCTAGNGQVTLTWQPPSSNGGAAITSYTVTASPGGTIAVTPDGNTLTAIVAGLTNGTTYTFTVHATNSAGSSSESVVSGSVTPFRYVDGQALGAGFSGRYWGSADAGSPTGYIYGFIGDDASGFIDLWWKKGQYALGSLETTVHRPNPPFTFLSLASVTQTGAGLLEAKAQLYLTSIEEVESQNRVIMTAAEQLEAQLRLLQSSRVTPLEAQLHAIQTGVERIETQLRLISTASAPLEAKLLLDVTAIERLEAGLHVSQTRLSPLEARTTLVQTGLAALENQIAASATRLLILEAQARLSASPAMPLEAKLRLLITGATALEAVAALVFSRSQPLEASAGLVIPATVALSSLLAVLQTKVSPLEAQLRLTITAQERLEALLGLAPSGLLSLESAANTSNVSETAILLLESLLMLEITAASVIESKALAIQTSLAGLEANHAATLLAVSPLETQQTALRTAVSALEALHRQIVSGAAGLEANQAATQQARGVLESLLALVRLQLLRVEATQPLTGSRVLDVESTLAMTPQALSLDLEALHRLLGLAPTHLEARGSILRSRDLPLETLLPTLTTALAGLESWRAVSPSASARFSVEAPSRLFQSAPIHVAILSIAGQLTIALPLAVESISAYIRKSQLLELDALARIFRVLPGQAAIIPLESTRVALLALRLLLEIRGYTAAELGEIPLESRQVFKNASAIGDLIIRQRPFTPGVDL